jgi:hypothetical protein
MSDSPIFSPILEVPISISVRSRSPPILTIPIVSYNTTLTSDTDTTIVNYCLSFADEGKHTFVFRPRKTYFRFPFPFAANKRKLPLSISSVFRMQQGDMDEDMDMDVVENMKTWTRTWKHGRGHGNMDKDMETWTRTWKHGQGHGNMDEDMETWTRTWKHG